VGGTAHKKAKKGVVLAWWSDIFCEMDIFSLLCSLNRALKMSTMAFYSKIEELPDHLKQQLKEMRAEWR
jgi:hypothetical protein